MYKASILFLSIVFSTNLLIGQVIGGTNEKLSKLYNSGKYEACFYKAEGVTLNEKTKKDPEAYLYIAMSLYKLYNSEDTDLQEDYKKGFKDAIKYIGKFAKYDKSGEMYANNIDFINELKNIQLKKVENYFNEQNYQKAATEAKQYSKLNHKQDQTLVLFIGMCEIMSNNYSQGSRNVDTAKKQLQNENSFTLEKQLTPLLTNSFISYTNFLMKDSQNDVAQETITLAISLIPNEPLLKVQQNKIKNTIESTNQTSE